MGKKFAIFVDYGDGKRWRGWCFSKSKALKTKATIMKLEKCSVIIEEYIR